METKLLPKYLPLNLQFFAEGAETNADHSSDATLNTEVQGDNTPAGSESTSTEAKAHMIPKTRFDEVNARYKDVQTKLDELLAQKAQAEKEAQEKQGKYQELYETTTKELTDTKTKYTDVETRAQQLEGVINGLLETKLEAIPAELHDLIPEHLTPEGKLDWINKAEAKGIFGKKQQAPVGETTSPSHSQAVDLNALSPISLLRAGYGSK